MSVEDLSSAAEQSSAVDKALTFSLQTLSPEQRAMLSKALFPDTHTDDVDLCGSSRKLRPLPIKWSKQIHALLEPFHKEVETVGLKEGDPELAKLEEHVDQTELDLLQMLLDVSLILANFYGWDDVQEKIKDEDVFQEELQSLVVRQLNLQKTNDFLLMGLRVLVGVMQQAEIQALKLLSMFSGQS